MDSITDFEWGAGLDVIDFSATLREMDYYVDLAYYTTAFADFTAIKAEAEEATSAPWLGCLCRHRWDRHLRVHEPRVLWPSGFEQLRSRQ